MIVHRTRIPSYVATYLTDRARRMAAAYLEFLVAPVMHSVGQYRSHRAAGATPTTVLWVAYTALMDTFVWIIAVVATAAVLSVLALLAYSHGLIGSCIPLRPGKRPVRSAASRLFRRLGKILPFKGVFPWIPPAIVRVAGRRKMGQHSHGNGGAPDAGEFMAVGMVATAIVLPVLHVLAFFYVRLWFIAWPATLVYNLYYHLESTWEFLKELPFTVLHYGIEGTAGLLSWPIAACGAVVRAAIFVGFWPVTVLGMYDGVLCYGLLGATGVVAACMAYRVFIVVRGIWWDLPRRMVIVLFVGLAAMDFVDIRVAEYLQELISSLQAHVA